MLFINNLIAQLVKAQNSYPLVIKRQFDQIKPILIYIKAL